MIYFNYTFPNFDQLKQKNKYYSYPKTQFSQENKLFIVILR